MAPATTEVLAAAGAAALMRTRRPASASRIPVVSPDTPPPTTTASTGRLYRASQAQDELGVVPDVARPAVARLAEVEIGHRSPVAAAGVETAPEVVVDHHDVAGVPAVGLARRGSPVDRVAAAVEQVVVDGHVLDGREVAEEGDGAGLAVPVLEGVVADGEAAGEAVGDQV